MSGPGAASASDYIGAHKDATLAKTLSNFRKDPKNESALAGFDASEVESILFADNLIKVNRLGTRQQRTLVITTIALFNFKPKVYGDFQRRIPIAYIGEMWLVDGTNEIGAFGCDERDALLLAETRMGRGGGAAAMQFCD